ncbi:MAG: hypothetical protein OXP66_05880 [Candidatus Tectomicrobia bacterium]|nr:hypothetical protein [Candidatus Tectomicrobia bacterium]
MNPEIWAIFGVGAALAALQWRLYGSLNANLNTRMDRIEARMDRVEGRVDHIEADLTGIKERLSRIEGWVTGLYREEPAPSA